MELPYLTLVYAEKPGANSQAKRLKSPTRSGHNLGYFGKFLFQTMSALKLPTPSFIQRITVLNMITTTYKENKSQHICANKQEQLITPSSIERIQQMLNELNQSYTHIYIHILAFHVCM